MSQAKRALAGLAIGLMAASAVFWSVSSQRRVYAAFVERKRPAVLVKRLQRRRANVNAAFARGNYEHRKWARCFGRTYV